MDGYLMVCLKVEILVEAMQKAVTPSARLAMAIRSIAQHTISIQLVCQIFKPCEVTIATKACGPMKTKRLPTGCYDASASAITIGASVSVFFYLYNIKGAGWHNERACLIYQELEINLRIWLKKRMECAKSQFLVVSEQLIVAGRCILCWMRVVMAVR